MFIRLTVMKTVRRLETYGMVVVMWEKKGFVFWIESSSFGHTPILWISLFVSN